ncbi:MAG TPA: hemerythrin domain-containing protein [Polyangia bacterium]|nr:hemerythrin domain-containing protein [Polyangia bacterium]
MNAIDLLKAQHRKVEGLFSKIHKAKDAKKKEGLFVEIADSLAIHATIEEHHFYPGVKAKSTEGLLLESVEEHLAMKRVLSDLLDLDVQDETFDAKLKVLQDLVEHHVEEEEDDLFPKVAKSLDKDQLAELAEAMESEQAELEERGNPRDAVPAETERAATI